MTSLASRALLKASQSAWLSEQVRRRRFAQRAVRRFMPGESLDAAIEAAARLKISGMGTILTQLGENVSSEAEARAVGAHYRGVLQAIDEQDLPSHISIKPTQLGLDVSPDLCRELLDGFLEQATETVWVDMEDTRYTDVTLDLVMRAAETHSNIGVCLQSYLYRTDDDLARLTPSPVTIRLVKGAYNEPSSVAYPKKRDVDDQYRALAGKLLKRSASGGPVTVLGTHDLDLLRVITDDASAIGASAEHYEVHMLYGIRSTEQKGFAAAGTKVRVLISYGEAWFPWYMRRLAERPANIWFVMRSMI